MVNPWSVTVSEKKNAPLCTCSIFTQRRKTQVVNEAAKVLATCLLNNTPNSNSTSITLWDVSRPKGINTPSVKRQRQGPIGMHCDALTQASKLQSCRCRWRSVWAPLNRWQPKACVQINFMFLSQPSTPDPLDLMIPRPPLLRLPSTLNSTTPRLGPHHDPVMDPWFPRCVGDNPLVWGKNLLFGKIFAKNCMKMKDIESKKIRQCHLIEFIGNYFVYGKHLGCHPGFMTRLLSTCHNFNLNLSARYWRVL